MFFWMASFCLMGTNPISPQRRWNSRIIVVSSGLDIGRGHLIEQGEFLPEVLLVFAVHTGEMRSLALEELVARGTETLPDLHPNNGATRHRSPSSGPAGRSARPSPSSTPRCSCSDFGGLAYLGLQLQVVLHLGLHPGIVAAAWPRRTCRMPCGNARRYALLSFLGAKPIVFQTLLDLQQSGSLALVPLLARS